MWEEDDSLFEEADRRIRQALNQAFSNMYDNLFDVEARCLKPLYRIEVDEDEVRVTFDLPCVAKEDISLTSTEDTISIEAKMVKPVSLKLGGHLQRRFEFEKYSKKIKLPVKVNPDKAKATFKNGVLSVRYNIARPGRMLKVK